MGDYYGRVGNRPYRMAFDSPGAGGWRVWLIFSKGRYGIWDDFGLISLFCDGGVIFAGVCRLCFFGGLEGLGECWLG